MKRIIISWIAWYYDFQGGEVDMQGPTYSLHERFWEDNCEKHVLLSSATSDDTRSEMLYTTLRRDFPDHDIALRYMDLEDILDFQEIKQKAMRVLREYEEYEIDILFSSGTTPMRTAWVLIHLENNGFRTHLIQGIDERMGEGEARFAELELDHSIFNFRIEIKRKALEQDRGDIYLGETLLPVYSRAEQIAQLDDITCLIRGESGTGKEKLARHMHEESIRRSKQLVAVNCAALGDELLESRLFGYLKGAFTGAHADSKGFFDEAHQGTLFLDEIGDISPYMQQALLRVLQEREITPVGSTTAHKVDVRIIAATNKDLWAMCEAGTFRWDLYYRLAMTELVIPALKEYSLEERRGLIDFMLDRLAIRYKRDKLKLSPEVAEHLLIYDFPGNIRELENILTHGYVFAEHSMKAKDLPGHFRRQQRAASLKLEDVEARHIEKVLKIKHGNLTHTYQALGLGSVNTLKSKMEKYGIQREI